MQKHKYNIWIDLLITALKLCGHLAIIYGLYKLYGQFITNYEWQF